MNEKVPVSDDLTNTWQESVAVKITAVVLYAVMLVASLVAAFFLWNAGERMERDYAERAERLAYRVSVDLDGGRTLADFSATVDRLLPGSGFSAAELRINDETARAGDPGTDPVAIIRSLPAGAGNIATLTLYHAPLHDAVRFRRNRVFIITGASALVFGLFLTWVILKFITRPIHALVAATRAATAGDLSVRLDPTQKDEFGALSRFFNSMLQRISGELAERRQAEERLRLSNNFIKTALDGMTDSIAVIDARNFIIQGVNRKFLEDYSLREEDVIGKACYEVTHRRSGPCGPPDDVCPMVETVATGGHSVAEHVHHEQDGRKVYVEVSASPIMDGKGEVVQVVHISRDITERKQAEELLRKNREQIANILDSVHAGILLIDPRRHEIVYANSYAANMIGALREGIIGRRCHQFVCPAEMGMCPITDQCETVDNSERVLIRADGSRLPIMKSAMMMPYNGEEHIIESFIDISAIKRTEQDLREANDELQAFIYSAAHDLRQPLVNIRGFSVELRQSLQEISAITAKHPDRFAPDERKRLDGIYQNDIQAEIGFIASSVERMDGLINALLKLSQLGRRDMRLERIDMNALVRTVQESLAHQVRERNAVLTVADLPEVVADRTAMEQVMANLLDNATKYLRPASPGAVEISGEWVNGEAVFQVKDNGRGIDRDDIPKLFRIFRRLGEQDTAGEGVGLAYVRSIVRKHGGRIWCDSELGVGTTFRFTIPRMHEGAR